jgi:AcrR family transcriptional regulator
MSAVASVVPLSDPVITTIPWLVSAHHFGDLKGLLSDLAAAGYTKFAAALSTATAQAGQDPRAGMIAMGRAYVRFARAHPGLFALMFRSERLDADRPSLRDAIEGARRVLRQGIAAGAAGRPLPPLESAARAVAAWSLVHGFGVLLLDGRLRALIASPPGDETADPLLEAVLNCTRVGDEKPVSSGA